MHPLHDIVVPSSIEDFVPVVIEIPKGSKLKYEIDKATGMLMLDRVLYSSVHYPANYGFIPQSHADDGDPLDVLVHTPHRVISGTVIRCRPVGILKMDDEAGGDAKLVAVPVSKLTPIYDDVKEVSDLPKLLVQQIVHFFEHYKDLEKGKWVKVEGWGSAEEAREEILKAIANFKHEEEEGTA